MYKHHTSFSAVCEKDCFYKHICKFFTASVYTHFWIILHNITRHKLHGIIVCAWMQASLICKSNRMFPEINMKMYLIESITDIVYI